MLTIDMIMTRNLECARESCKGLSIGRISSRLHPLSHLRDIHVQNVGRAARMLAECGESMRGQDKIRNVFKSNRLRLHHRVGFSVIPSSL